MPVLRRFVSAIVGLSFIAAALPCSTVPANAATLRSRFGPVRSGGGPISPVLHGTLGNGQSATIFSNGTAEIFTKDRSSVEFRKLSPDARAMLPLAKTPPYNKALLNDLMLPVSRAYAPQTVNVVFQAGATISQDVTTTPRATLLQLRKTSVNNLASIAPRLTNDIATNTALARLGVDRTERIARQFSRGSLSAMRSRAGAATSGLLDISNAFRLHITGTSIENAVRTLRALPTVAYAAPDWTVSSMRAASVPIPASLQRQVQARAVRLSSARAQMSTSTSTSTVLPSNYGTTSSLQSYQNAPGVDSIAAYDEIGRAFGQLPGQGEIITNVSIGDLDDSSALSNPNDPCGLYVGIFGPTTHVIGGQRYLDLPSMPLIPAYAADATGTLNGDGEICGLDPFLGEVGLDFSVMAPLPHNMQRAGEIGSGLTDLLGIAPGASYRLVVVGSTQQLATNSYAIGALLGAAMQSPAPNVITASLGFGFDSIGFPGRYLEEDPLTESVIQTIVQGSGIAVCISANDGTRYSTNVAIGPSGGSAATNIATGYSTQTSLGDIGYSTAPSSVIDTGSFDVGGTTTDDIFALQPQAAGSNASYTSREPFVETRFDGFTSFSSGEGRRVNLAAPSDNIVAFEHWFGGYDAVSVNLDGGTSASAPETAAAIAVVQQVARLTGHPFQNPQAIRTFLTSNGTPVLQPPSADPLSVGTQLDVARAVESLLAAGGKHSSPFVPRVAIAQRRSGDFNFYPSVTWVGALDAVFQEDTDPTAIDLAGPADPATGANSDEDANAYITIAPDWENLPVNAQFALSVVGRTSTLATSRYARLLPSQILAAAGLPLASSSTRTVKLRYRALYGTHVLYESDFALTFGPADPTSELVLAPIVPPVVTGDTIPVQYDLSTYPVGMLRNPTLVVSYPGRTNPSTGGIFFAAYSVPLTALRGTVNVPVSALQGGGEYGIGIALAPPQPYTVQQFSDFAYTRVAPLGSVRPPAPLLAQAGVSPESDTHTLEIPYGAPLKVKYDVSSVKHATGALIEISATGTQFGLANPFNNPNGTVIDANGRDTGSIQQIPVAGTTDSITLNTIGTGSIHLTPAMAHVIRVIPLDGGAPIAEAGDVSYVSMDGVVPADGGYLNFGFAANVHGNDGFLTSEQYDADGNQLNSVESFRQSDNTIVNPSILSGSSDDYFVPGWGIFGNDTGLFGDSILSPPYSVSFSLLNPTSGAVGSTIGLPNWQPSPILANFAPDTTTTTPALFHMPFAYRLNLMTGTFSAPLDLSQYAQSSGDDAYNSFAANNSTGDVFTEFFSLNYSPTCLPGQILYGNMNTGIAGTFPGPGFNFFQVGAIAVDSTSNKAAVFSSCNGALAVIDLNSHTTGSLTPIPGMAGFLSSGVLYTTIDEAHGLVFVHSAYSPDWGINNNSLSSVFTFDESGHYLGANENFFFYNTFFLAQANFLTVNPSTRTGYDFGPLQTQLEPFSY